MFSSRVTVIDGHNKFQDTDHLYDPLRKTFLLDTTARKSQFESISQFSHVSHSVKTHTAVENISLAEHTFIPQDTKLVPTHHFWKVPKDHQYYIVNVEYKEYPPLSQEEMAKILEKQRSREEIIVYEIDELDEEEGDTRKVFNRNNQFELPTTKEEQYRYVPYPIKSYRFKEQEEVTQIATVRPAHQNQERFILSPHVQPDTNQANGVPKQKPLQNRRRNYSNELKKKGSGIMVTQSKYNFFSALDEGLNNLLVGKSCTCPANQIVANQINEISWYGTNIR